MAQEGSKLKVIIKAFLRTLPLRIAPSSQEAFSSSVNPLMTGPPLCLSARWLRCRLYALLSKNIHNVAFTFSRNLASLRHLKPERPQSLLCLKGDWKWKDFVTNVTRAAIMWWLMMKTMTVFLSSPCKEYLHLKQHKRNGYKGQRVWLQWHILIEKCTHVKRRKMCYWEK